MERVQDLAATPGFDWAGRAVDIDSVERELGRAWRENASRTTAGGAPLATRTHVLNLIVHASSPQEVEHVAELIERLGVHHPSRTLILLAQPDAPTAAVSAWINTHLHDLPGTNRRLAFEQITIAAQGAAAQSLAAIVDPLLISELPNFLWWLGEPPFRSSLFAQITDMVDRLIVSSATFRDLPTALHELAELMVIPNGVTVSDFAWGRLRPWRELVAQFFDPPELTASLAAIAAVEIAYEPRGGPSGSGLSQAILALGWLCSRLGWQVHTPPRRGEDGALRWTLYSAGRTIDANLSPQHHDDGVGGMRALAIKTAGEGAGSFHVYRDSVSNLATSMTVPGASQPDRVARATVREESDLLLHDLNQFTRDRIYEGALVFAAQLVRGLDGATL